ncbi:MAG TPA: isocitrate lyase/phosphoenolpyruvate mutase family protein [Rhodanobacter sp.]|jgi:2-methylisocitrate lyase-like PEP mutase family enzyme|nr:isocitrate lyase/phosphoenolpyruvate mutase family protein [Rhodanobacter sp.]
MDRQSQIDKAHAFRDMHDRNSILLLPNAWDAGSARLFAQRGFAAVATTSGGVAWSLGCADGEQAPVAEVVAAIARITRVVDVPVTADIEAGYGDTPAAVGDTVRAVIEAGAVGVNLEDGRHDGLRDCAEAAERIAGARAAATAAGVPIVINARVDCWITPAADETVRFADAVRRARAYLAAGADCIYPIGLGDPAVLAALVKTIDAPVNVGARPGMPGLAELARIGVARVSTATRFAAIALGAVDQAAQAMRASGGFDSLAPSLSHADVQKLFVHG